MVIAEKAGETMGPLASKIFRQITSTAVVLTLYGSCVLLIVLMAT